MKKIYLTGILTALSYVVCAQRYTLQDLEAYFIKNNTRLVAEKLNIDKAQADIAQEKQWQNPSLAINEINLWKNPSHEQLPDLFGHYGGAQQISLELEQLIETAGKRQKRIKQKEITKVNVALAYQDVTRSLKKELRQTYNHLAGLNTEHIQLKAIITRFEQMYIQYNAQAEQKNISRIQTYRIQAELMNLKKECVALESEIDADLNKIMVVTQLPKLSISQLQFGEFDLQLTRRFPLNLTELALNSNVGLKQQINKLQLAQVQLALERAQHTPDIALQINYDRGGNIMRDFIGFGIRADLPLLNRNKGAIQAARYTTDQEEHLLSTLKLELNHSIDRLLRQLQQYELVLQQWKTRRQIDEEQLVFNYDRQLKEKQITLLEFIDFTQAIRTTQKSYLELWNEYIDTFEELQHIIGQEF